MKIGTILAHRIARHGLVSPARNEKEYLDLIKRLQPITPVAHSMPGKPPRLMHRCLIDDRTIADKLRVHRRLLKGRFCGGRIGYVLADDFELYGTAFRKPIGHLNTMQNQVLDILRHNDGLSQLQLREEIGIQHKKTMPVLHRLQEAFLVFEDQGDDSWDRPWSVLDSALPDVNLDRLPWDEAAMRVIKRFLQSHVFATFQQLNDWSGFTKRALENVLMQLKKKELVPVQINGIEGWMCSDEQNLDLHRKSVGVFMLHRLDPLILPNVTELRKRFEGLEVLQYLLIDGELVGAVCGHWRIGPHDVEDIVLKLPSNECTQRKHQIIREVGQVYHPPDHHILRFAGKNL